MSTLVGKCFAEASTTSNRCQVVNNYSSEVDNLTEKFDELVSTKNCGRLCTIGTAKAVSYTPSWVSVNEAYIAQAVNDSTLPSVC